MKFLKSVKVETRIGRVKGSMRICRILMLSAILGLLLGTHTWAQTKTAAAKPEPAKKAEYAVTLGRDVLFYVRSPIKAYGPEQRAAAISERVTKLAEDVYLRPESITVSDDGFTADIAAGDLIVMAVTDQDAQAEGRGRTRQELAKEYAEKIRFGIEKYRGDFSRKSILLGFLYSLIATVLLVAILLLIK